MAYSLAAFVLVVGLFLSCRAAEPLTVHVVAHTHDDVGWLKTVDEYYYGANNTIQHAGVQYILDSVIQALVDNPERKFIYVEIAFFIRWWDEQTNAKKDIVRALVTEGRLEFINGGWCMNDEATTDFESIVDQMTLGHRFLLREFGVVPRIGWHIDPFGHSAMHPVLFAQMGFDGFFFSRIDYQDFQWRIPAKQLELVWRGSKSLGSSVDMFTSVINNGYCGFFLFEWDNIEPVQDDPRLFNVNIKWWADFFAQVAHSQASAYRTNHVMVPLGCDFAYENANVNFKNMDKLIKYFKNHPEYGLNVKYSTPSIYTDAVHSANLTWTVKTDDFFPYADDSDSYWSGYYTSRSALKGYVRSRNALLKATETLFVTSAQGSPSDIEAIDVLQQAQGVAQHHDAVSGTEKQHVAYDYAMRLSIGSAAAHSVLNNTVSNLMSKTAKPSFSFCPLLNESSCPALEVLKSSGVAVPVVVYNSLGWQRQEYLRLPVPTGSVKVTDSKGAAVASQVVSGTGGYTLIFQATLGPLAYTTYFIQTSTVADDLNTVVEEEEPDHSQATTILENEYLQVAFDSASGSLKSIKDKASGVIVNVGQDYLYYIGHTNANGAQASGAYIFRPQGTSTYPYGNNANPTVTVTRGSLMQSVRRAYSAELTQVFRLYAGQHHLEIEDIIGPIDVSDGNGKEVITRYSTDLSTNKTWFTDANGMEMQQRWFNFRPTWNYVVTEPIAGNYFPMNAIAYIQDTTKNTQFTVLSDRSRGASSLANGQLETMLHRRLLYDDGRGVGEPLDEDTQIATTEYIVVGSITDSAKLFRPLAKRLAHPPVLMFSQTSNPAQWLKNFKLDFAPMQAALPANLQLLNLKPNEYGESILRLHHIFQVGEDQQLSQPVTVDLQKLFNTLNVVWVEEMNLSAVKKKSDVHRLHWNTASEEIKKAEPNSKAMVVTIKPMDIRTFLVRFQSEQKMSVN